MFSFLGSSTVVTKFHCQLEGGCMRTGTLYIQTYRTLNSQCCHQGANQPLTPAAKLSPSSHDSDANSN